MPKKFDFLSPGIEINEVDLSVIPPTPEEEGPIIIGRTRRGPALKPVKIRNREDFISVFGHPVPGGGTGEGDIWRAGPNVSAPTYASYAAQSWLASGNSPVVMVRLLGDNHTQGSAYGIAGWELSGSDGADTDKTKNSTAYGLFVIDSGSCGVAGEASFEFNRVSGGGAITDYHGVGISIDGPNGSAVVFDIYNHDQVSTYSGPNIVLFYTASVHTTDIAVIDAILPQLQAAIDDSANSLSEVGIARISNKLMIYNQSTSDTTAIAEIGGPILTITDATAELATGAPVGNAGSLAAVFYVHDSGSVVLSGSMLPDNNSARDVAHAANILVKSEIIEFARFLKSGTNFVSVCNNS